MGERGDYYSRALETFCIYKFDILKMPHAYMRKRAIYIQSKFALLFDT